MFISSQIWVAFCLTLLCYFFQKVNGWENDTLLYLSFFATIFSYNLAHWEKHKHEYWRLFLMLSSLVGCIWLALDLSLWTLFVLLVLGCISVFYSVPILDRNLRNIPFLKMFWIAFVWSITVILPFFESWDLVWWKVLLQVLSVFCFVVAITIPFDIRDMELDYDKIQTIPQKMGKERSIQLGYQMLILSFFLFFSAMRYEINAFLMSYLISILLAFYGLRKSATQNSKWFTSFWVEGLSAVPWLVYSVIELR